MECVICLEPLNTKNKRLQCGHEFHDECVETWLQDNTTCPVCRQDVEIEENDNKYYCCLLYIAAMNAFYLFQLIAFTNHLSMGAWLVFTLLLRKDARRFAQFLIVCLWVLVTLPIIDAVYEIELNDVDLSQTAPYICIIISSCLHLILWFVNLRCIVFFQ